MDAPVKVRVRVRVRAGVRVSTRVIRVRVKVRVGVRVIRVRARVRARVRVPWRSLRGWAHGRPGSCERSGCAGATADTHINIYEWR